MANIDESNFRETAQQAIKKYKEGGKILDVLVWGTIIGLYEAGLEAAKREARGYAESIDNVREALGLKETHYLVIANDVEDVVKALEQCEEDGSKVANRALTKLRQHNNG